MCLHLSQGVGTAHGYYYSAKVTTPALPVPKGDDYSGYRYSLISSLKLQIVMNSLRISTDMLLIFTRSHIMFFKCLDRWTIQAGLKSIIVIAGRIMILLFVPARMDWQRARSGSCKFSEIPSAGRCLAVITLLC
jgi:hypothetical protein